MDFFKADGFESWAPKDWREILLNLKPTSSKEVYCYVLPRPWFWAIEQDINDNSDLEEGLYFNGKQLIFIDGIELPILGKIGLMPLGG